ncbi:PhoP regulatory network protein YrbL [Rhodobacteraceae bacterium THAF1]|nr:PhoP regulatory network protein YrbL [Palleronia sp. THAF1]VDC16756.1 PhoP regulatory network protein YrbL [Rhodobacteraceae bacterium THAF1]
MESRLLRKTFDLSGLSPLTSGTRRQVYMLDDVSPPLVLKVIDLEYEIARLSPAKRFIRKWMPLSHHRMMIREASHQGRVAIKAGPCAPKIPLPQFRGLVQTSRGPGAVWEALTADNGTLAPTLSEEITRLGSVETFLPQINRLLEQILAFGILVLDFHPGNVVVSGWEDGPELVLIDGFGRQHLVPIREVFPRLGRKRLFAQCEIFARKTGCKWDPVARKFVGKASSG